MAYFSNWRITRTNVLFVVGVVVLAAVVFGGVWIVKERGEQARRDEAVKIAEQNLKDQSEVAVNKANEAVKKASGENGASTEQVTAPSNADASGSSSAATIPTTSTVPELPTTGTEFTNVIVITLLSLAVAFYVTSRKAVHER